MGEPSKQPRNPDVSIAAAAKVRELRFEEVPGTEVRFHGSSESRSGTESERENLPERVERNVVYRDARIRYRAAARAVEPDPDEPEQSKRRKNDLRKRREQ